MPRRKNKNSGGPPRCSMYPSLHDDVMVLLEDEGLYFTFLNSDVPSLKEYSTNIMGRFQCNNRSCSNSGWSSKRIAIKIHMYHGRKYNAKVYHQRCIRCKQPSEPILDDSYAERVAYRLKKWSGIEQDRPPRFYGSKGPHESALCEGCKAGICKAGD